MKQFDHSAAHNSTQSSLVNRTPDARQDPLSHHLFTMACNNAWTNHRLATACAGLAQPDFEAARTSFFPSIRSTLHHILDVDCFYVDALEREARGAPPHPDIRQFFRPAQPALTAAAMRAAQLAVDRRLIAYCAALRDADLPRIVTIVRPTQVQQETRSRLLAHVFTHQVHHRGQVHAMLSGTPVAPPQLDEFFSAMDAPLRARELAELGLSEETVWPKAG